MLCCFQVLSILNVFIPGTEPDVESAPAPLSEPPGVAQHDGEDADLHKSKEKKKSKPRAMAE